jgi:hypothetical protein
MAKPTWLTVTPGSGSGDGTLTNTGLEHTGRVLRTGTVTVTADGVSGSKTYTVNQEPKPEFCAFDNGASMSVSKDGGTVTVSGKSNSKALTFSFVGSAGNVTLPSTYSAGGASTSNGSAISGDPGATAQYSFSVSLSVPKNTTITAIARTLKVTNGGDVSAQITLNQTAGDAYLTLSETTITLPYSGTPAVSVAVSSNTSWTVS